MHPIDWLFAGFVEMLRAQRNGQGELEMKLGRAAVMGTSVFALSACAGDNPDNVPLYGEWEMTTRIQSLTIDGQAVPSRLVPQEVKDLEKTETICGEPMFIDKDWQEDDINSRMPGQCTLDQYDVTPTFVSGRGRCEASTMQGEFNPVVGIGINQSEATYTMEIIMEGTARLPGNMGSRYLRAVAVQDGKRLGDC